MAFEVFFEGYLLGRATHGGGPATRRELEPYIISEEPQYTWLKIAVGGGTAEIYLGRNAMMATHVAGEDTWELLFQAARKLDWVICLVGCPTFLTDESQRSHLPADLADDVVLVNSGEELFEAIMAS